MRRNTVAVYETVGDQGDQARFEALAGLLSAPHVSAVNDAPLHQTLGENKPKIVVRSLTCGRSPAILVARARLTSQVFLGCDGGPASEPRAAAFPHASRIQHGCISASALKIFALPAFLSGAMGPRERLSRGRRAGIGTRKKLPSFVAAAPTASAAVVATAVATAVPTAVATAIATAVGLLLALTTTNKEVEANR